MIKILDWYIIKKLVTTTVFIVIIFSVIASVVDASEKADDFVKSGQTAYYILTKYFAGFVAFIISMIFPLMVFIAVILFTSKMAGRSEIVAMLAGGVKYTRILRPYLIGAILLGALMSILVEQPSIRFRDKWFPALTGVQRTAADDAQVCKD